MSSFLYRQSFIRDNFALMIGVCLCFYFSYHAVQGNRSFMREMMLNHSIAQLSQEYDDVKAQRVALETKVKMMRPGSVSRDLLEERARVVLGYQGRDEMTLLAK